MQNRNSTNRHGIPLYGGTPNKCCWPQCPWPADRVRKVPVCTWHGDHIWRAVNAQKVAQEEAEARLAVEHEKVREANAQAAKAKIATIYYLKVGGGHIKIGWTTNLEKRMRGYPPNTELLAVHPGTRADEKQLHRRFAVHRSYGNEWYPLVPVLLDHIKRVIAEHGQPPEVSFGAKPVEVPRPHQQKTQLAAKYGPMRV